MGPKHWAVDGPELVQWAVPLVWERMHRSRAFTRAFTITRAFVLHTSWDNPRWVMPTMQRKCAVQFWLLLPLHEEVRNELHQKLLVPNSKLHANVLHGIVQFLLTDRWIRLQQSLGLTNMRITSTFTFASAFAISAGW